MNRCCDEQQGQVWDNALNTTCSRMRHWQFGFGTSVDPFHPLSNAAPHCSSIFVVRMRIPRLYSHSRRKMETGPFSFTFISTRCWRHTSASPPYTGALHLAFERESTELPIYEDEEESYFKFAVSEQTHGFHLHIDSTKKPCPGDNAQVRQG